MNALAPPAKKTGALLHAPKSKPARNYRTLNTVQVSYVENASSTETKDVSIGKIIDAIRSGGKRLHGQITQIRNRFEAELDIGGDYKKAKEAVDPLKKELPGILWSGQFSSRERPVAEKLMAHQGRLCADLDSLKSELAEIRKKLEASPHVEVLFRSPSGDGLKAVLRVPADPSKHLASFRAVQKHLRELTGVEIDEACKDVGRLCFMSCDPEIYVNENAVEIEPLPEAEKPARIHPNGIANVSERQRITSELLGQIDWQSQTTGFLQCPGKHLHTTGDGERDCRVVLDGAPTVHCFHDHCRGIIDAINHELRSRIAKVEYAANNNNRPALQSCGDCGPAEQTQSVALYVPPPLELLPSHLQDYVYAASEAINVDVSFVFLPLLSVIGAAIGNARSIILKRGFTQPPVIWTGIIGRSGSRKSPSIEAACFAAMEHEGELMRQNKQSSEQYANELANWESKSKKERGPEPEEPAILTSVLDDLTIEVLADALTANPHGVLVRKDELSHWIASFDQYRSNKGSDVSRWLTLHSGFFFGLDRRTDKRHYRIVNPRVCLTGGIQPQILRRVLTPEFFERGLPARFLFAFPPFRQDRWSEAVVPDDLRERILEMFSELWLLQPDPRQTLLPLEPEAKEIYTAFYDECGASAVETDERGEAAWSKLTGYAARLALVGQVVGEPCAQTVSGEVMSAACNLADWCGNEAIRIYAMLAETTDQREQRELVEFIERRGSVVTVRDVIRCYWPLKDHREKAEQMLEQLAKTGRGKWEELRPPGRGRPTRAFRLLRASTSTKILRSRGKTANYVDVEEGNASKITSAGDSNFDPALDDVDAFLPADIADMVI
jgi:hypothetical protein